MQEKMRKQLESILGYLETESYLMAYRALTAIEKEYDDPDEWLSIETKTDLDVLHTALRIVIGERSGHLETLRKYAQNTGFYERLAYLLTKKLLGNKTAGLEVDTLMFCEEALGKVRRN